MKNQILPRFKFKTRDGMVLPVVFLAFDKREAEVMVRRELPDKKTHTTYVHKLSDGILYRDLRGMPIYKETVELKKKWYQFWK